MSHPAQLSNALSRCLLPHPWSWAGTLHPIPAPPTPCRAVTVERWSGLPTPLLKQRRRHLPLIPAWQAGTGRQAGPDLRQGDAVPRSGAQNSSGPPQIWTGGRQWGREVGVPALSRG